MVVALLTGNVAQHRVAGALEVELVQHRFEERGVHPLPFARFLTVQQRQQDALAEEHAGRGVADGDPDPHRPAPRFPGDGHQTAHALDDLVDPGTLAVRAVLAET